MARRHQARDYLLEGLSPEQISRRMGISLSSVRQYLCTVLGEGELLRTDIAFSIEKAQRDAIENALFKTNLRYNKKIHSRLTVKRTSHEVISLYLLTRDPRPDLYNLIGRIELLLHDLVKRVLMAVHGDDWWRKGIPERVRIECQARREQDETPVADPYQYTTFMDLKQIIEQEWPVFSKALPTKMISSKRKTLLELHRTNRIRNRVMHPVKDIGDYEEDYLFVRAFLADCDEENWRIDGEQSAGS